MVEKNYRSRPTVARDATWKIPEPGPPVKEKQGSGVL